MAPFAPTDARAKNIMLGCGSGEATGSSNMRVSRYSSLCGLPQNPGAADLNKNTSWKNVNLFVVR